MEYPELKIKVITKPDPKLSLKENKVFRLVSDQTNGIKLIRVKRKVSEELISRESMLLGS